MEKNKQKQDLSGIATLSGNPLATYHLVGDTRPLAKKQNGGTIKKGGRK